MTGTANAKNPLTRKASAQKTPKSARKMFLVPGFFRPVPEVKKDQRSRQKHGKKAVQDIDDTQGKDLQTGQIDAGGKDTRERGPDETPAQEKKHEGRNARGQRGRKTKGEPILAEQTDGKGIDPVPQYGLFKIFQPIQLWDRPVAGSKHFPWDLTVSRFIGNGHGADPQWKKIDQTKKKQQYEGGFFHGSAVAAMAQGTLTGNPALAA